MTHKELGTASFCLTCPSTRASSLLCISANRLASSKQGARHYH